MCGKGKAHADCEVTFERTCGTLRRHSGAELMQVLSLLRKSLSALHC